jgi:uncharacterized protein YqeY
MTVYEGIQNHARLLLKKQDSNVQILKVVLGELQRSMKPPTDETCYQTIKKMVQNNEETYKLRPSDTLAKETSFLKSLLPVELTMEEISHHLLNVMSQIREAKSEGMAIGIAMKVLKATGQGVNSAMVASIVKSVRS